MTVAEIFESMEFGPAPENAEEALAWLARKGDRFGHFIDGAFTAPGAGFEARNPATGEVLASLTQASQADAKLMQILRIPRDRRAARIRSDLSDAIADDDCDGIARIALGIE